MSRNLSFKYLYLVLSVMAVVALLVPQRAYSLPLTTYAENSVLANGRWVKVSVDETGVYMVSDASLRKMGFSDPSKVNVYGYGAVRQPDNFNTYSDDLPKVQTLRTDRGIIFYAQGPTTFTKSTAGLRYPVQNPFTTKGYYFLSDCDATPRAIDRQGKVSQPAATPTTFTDIVFHELDQYNPGQTGHCLLGEDFLYNSSRSFSFTLADVDTSSSAVLGCSFMAKSSAQTKVKLKVNSVELPQEASDFVPRNTDDHGHYREGVIVKDFDPDSEKLTVTVSISNIETLELANLNYLVINYRRPLKLPASGKLAFTLPTPTATMDNVSTETVVWDVTVPLDITELETTTSGSSCGWRNSYTGERRYVAFNPSATFPEPTYVSTVDNQNIHGEPVPDMVIFTIGAWADQARRLADYRANSVDSLKVLVLDQDLVFNEFSSGARDVNAFRKCLKMFYDRSAESDSAKLQFALFMGRGSYDNRQLTSAAANLGYPIMPLWHSDSGSSDTDSYTTDDIFAFLYDDTGSFGVQRYAIGVGRLPVASQASAKAAVDKIIQYETQMPTGDWRNRALLIADDDDNGVHMDQTERMHANMLQKGGSDIFYHKIFTDRWQREAGQYPQARDEMFRKLDEGVAWWIFIGHANTSSWTHERLLTYNDINNLYLRRYPIVVAACCDFLRWDAREISAAEVMWALNSGGAISVISAVRPSYISDNGTLCRNFGNYVFLREDDGRRLPQGEIMRRTKMSVTPDTNKLRYVLIGDPAMRPIIPDNRVVLTSVGDTPLNSEEQPVLAARQQTTLEGYIADGNGNPIDDFTGVVSTTLYDAEYSITTLGQGTNGAVRTFEQQGDRIFAGNDSVVSGKFIVKVAMPSEITNNYRPAAANIFARSADGKFASGVNRDFYVFGEDFSVTDDNAPVIRSIYINHPSFRNGDAVNTTPYLIAEIADDAGINISTAGVGHQMTAMLDGKKNFSDVSQYYTPSLTEAAAGVINYPLGTLVEGEHTLRLRVWDTSGNSASSEITFLVVEDQAPIIYDIYADSNPASVSTNFYLTHDRPDANIQVTITVYNLLGKLVWSSTTSGRSDMFLSYPIQWDLTDTAGRRVQRGIYLYRATITEDGIESSSRTKRIAVTG